jgi:hypothetical protein
MMRWPRGLGGAAMAQERPLIWRHERERDPGGWAHDRQARPELQNLAT